LRLFGAYETGMKLPPTYSEDPVYTLIIESEYIKEKLSIYPKTKLLIFLESFFKKVPNSYNKTKSNFCSKLFKRKDFLNKLTDLEITAHSNTETENGRNRITINPTKKYLDLEELKTLLEIGKILAEEIKPARNTRYI
jgi:hypothetical protein